ncbi:UNVERIFIED_CONTAM: hypothetical protein FKN15_013721 [Acipenser sinensis]
MATRGLIPTLTPNVWIPWTKWTHSFSTPKMNTVDDAVTLYNAMECKVASNHRLGLFYKNKTKKKISKTAHLTGTNSASSRDTVVTMEGNKLKVSLKGIESVTEVSGDKIINRALLSVVWSDLDTANSNQNHGVYQYSFKPARITPNLLLTLLLPRTITLSLLLSPASWHPSSPSTLCLILFNPGYVLDSPWKPPSSL